MECPKEVVLREGLKEVPNEVPKNGPKDCPRRSEQSKIRFVGTRVERSGGGIDRSLDINWKISS